MYKNLESYNQRSNLNLFFLLLLLACFISAICFYFFYFLAQQQALRRKEKNVTTIQLFTKLIHEYLQRSELSQNKNIQIIIKSFKFTDNLFLGYNHKGSEVDFLAILTEKCFPLLHVTTIKNGEFYKSEEVWKILTFVIDKVGGLFDLNRRYNYVAPWGTNWYVFSITFPRFLIFSAFLYRFQFGEPNSTIETWIKALIPLLLDSPAKSLGWTREGINSLMMSVPWIGYHILIENFENATQHRDFRAVISYMTRDYVITGEGFYPDGGFVTHTHLRGYGYVFDSFKDSHLLIQLLDLQVGYIEKIAKIFNVLEHPAFNLHFPFLFTRSPSIGFTYRTYYNSYENYTIPSMRIVSFKKPKYLLQFFVQHPKLYYYEADQNNFNWAQYAAMARQFIYENNDIKIYKEFVTYYPGVISQENRHVEVKSRTTTTEGFLPTFAKSIVMELNSNCVAVYNNYKIERLLDVEIEEMMLITDQGYTVMYYCNLNNDNDEQLINQLVISMNFGHLMEKMKSTPKLCYFKDTSSILHSATQNIVYSKVKRVEDSMIYDSAQVKIGSSKLVCFSTFHGHIPLVLKHHQRRIITTPQYQLYFHNDNLYLIDRNSNTALVGKHEETAAEIITLKSRDIRAQLGKNIFIEENGVFDSAKNEFTNVVDSQRQHTKFTNITLLSDEDIIKNVNNELRQHSGNDDNGPAIGGNTGGNPFQQQSFF